MSEDLKLDFIKKTMQEYMADVKQLMAATADRMGVNKTGAGKASLASQTTTEGPSTTGKLSFKEYLRFVDMGVGRGHPLGGLKSVKVELASRKKGGSKFVKDNTFKPRKIYAKVAYGLLSPMYNRLLYGFTEETIQMLKTELQSETPNIEIT